MTTRFAPKTRILTNDESPSSFETWKENLVFNLTIDGSFEEFLVEGFSWSSPSVENRGLINGTGEDTPRRTAKQKLAYLNLMLGSIASYAPIISRRFITQEAVSLDAIWSRLRTHFGFRKTGALILDLHNISPEAGESHEALWERLYSFIDDNLLSPNDNIKHLGGGVTESETITPTLLNITVVTWLRCIHSGLPALVKQRYATELRNNTLSSLRDEISESLDALISDLSNDGVVVSRSSQPNRSRYQNKQNFKSFSSQNQNRSCVICLTAKRTAGHYLSECPYLPDDDRRYLKSRTRLVEASEEEELQHELQDDEASVRRVDIESSPELHVLCNSHPVPLLIDSGAESNLIQLDYARSIGADILKTKTKASQADGKSNLRIVGEVHLNFQRYPHVFKFNGLVAECLKDKVIAGIPFQSMNDVYVRPAKKTIHIGDKEVINYNATRSSRCSNRSTAIILRVPRQTTLLPGDMINIPVPDDLKYEDQVAVEPRCISPSLSGEKISNMWLKPQIITTKGDYLELKNTTDRPVLLKKHEQVANVRPVTSSYDNLPYNQVVSSSQPSKTINGYLSIVVDPSDVLSKSVKQQFHQLHHKYHSVFYSRSIGLYNGFSGPLEVKVNMGPTLPPQRKGRMPLYNRSLQEEYQDVCDTLDGTVLVKPEDAGITVEYLNPSFLVRKPSGKKRLVTAFGEVGQYSKPQPALLPSVDQTLRTLGNWKWIVKTDLSSAYWQMPLCKDSMKYCGIVTPFRGIRVYARGAMGMPGTETALEEMMCRILGDLLLEGVATKIADDLYCGADSPEDVLRIWEKILICLEQNGLKLSPAKTVCCPTSVDVLGWIWSNGTLQASSHRLSALEAVEPPKTVGKLRSYIGSYKYLGKVIPTYSDVLSPLDDVVAGRNSTEKISWSDSLLEAFRVSQKRLASAKVITIPRKEDQLQIITDASQIQSGIAATLYIVKEKKPLVAGFFNAKLRKHQVNWLPCELEALAIGAAINHFGPYIIESNHQTVVLSDSRPCVQAYEKLCRGEFSASSRVSTFLSIISRYQMKLIHIKGSDNVIADYASRNPLQCVNQDCQLCCFIKETEDSVIRSCSVQDVLDSRGTVPFSTRSAWHELQQSCQNLRRTSAHLRQGTTPSKKESKIKDVKRYLRVARIGKDGLVVVHRVDPLSIGPERIVVPRSCLHGLLVCLHLKLQHPSKAQLRKVFNRAFYALDAETAMSEINERCHICVSLQDMPNKFLEQSSTVPEFVGSNYSADVVRRECQFIFIIRENVSAYTLARIIPDEKSTSLKEALLVTCSQVRSKCGPPIAVRVDPAPGWRSLISDKVLTSRSIELSIGEEKNKNKNPVVDKAIRELHSEINRLCEHGGKVTDLLLAEAISNLNDRIRSSGLSAREIWTKRDQFTGKQLPVNDGKLIVQKVEERNRSHKSSSKYRSRGKSEAVYPEVSIGELVYINSDRDKTKRRDRYIVVKQKDTIVLRPNTVCLQKFSGSQLRSRHYIVNLADVIKVPIQNDSHVKYTDVSSEDDELQPGLAIGREENHQHVLETDEESLSSDSGESVIREEGNGEMGRRRSCRERRPPAHLQDYVVGDLQ